MLCWEGLPRLGCCVYCFFFYLLLCCWCVVLYWVSRGSCLTQDWLRVDLMCLLQPLLCLCCQDLPELDFELNLCVYCNSLCFNCACACVRRRSGLVSLQVDMLCLQQPLLYLCCASVSSCVRRRSPRVGLWVDMLCLVQLFLCWCSARCVRIMLCCVCVRRRSPPVGLRVDMLCLLQPLSWWLVSTQPIAAHYLHQSLTTSFLPHFHTFASWLMEQETKFMS